MRLLRASMFAMIDIITLIPKNGVKKSFSFQAKASISSIPMRRMCLWRPIIKGMKIITGIQVCLIWQANFRSTKNGVNKSFSCETKASRTFIPMRRISLWCLILKKKDITIWIHVCPNWQINLNSKKWWKEKLFLWSQNVNVIYPIE